MMASVVAGFGVLIALMGVAAMAVPQLMRELAASMRNPRALYGAMAARIVVGVFFLVASDACARPLAVGTIGVLLLVAAFWGLFVGVGTLEAMLDRFLALPDGVWRVWAGMAVAFGAFVVYAAI